jgi:hypothetical protein
MSVGSTTNTTPNHPILAELLALIESEAANPGPIVKALEAYLLGLLAGGIPAADAHAVRAACAKHGL